VFSTGVGSTDGAGPPWAAGKLWFKVPETVKVTYTGALQPGVFRQDLVCIWLAKSAPTAPTYEAIRVGGPVIDAALGRGRA